MAAVTPVVALVVPDQLYEVAAPLVPFGPPVMLTVTATLFWSVPGERPL